MVYITERLKSKPLDRGGMKHAATLRKPSLGFRPFLAGLYDRPAKNKHLRPCICTSVLGQDVVKCLIILPSSHLQQVKFGHCFGTFLKTTNDQSQKIQEIDAFPHISIDIMNMISTGRISVFVLQKEKQQP